jgi:uncharacterized membrane protein YphA (DoxX/SURF4 family)
MKNPFITRSASNLGLFIGRLQVGMYFVLEGAYKLHAGSEQFVKTHLNTMPSFVPQDSAQVMLLMLPWIQILAGAMIIFGLFGRIGAAVTAAILVCIVGTKGMLAAPLDVLFHHTLSFLGIAILLALHGGGDWNLQRLPHLAIFKSKSRRRRSLREPAHATGTLAETSPPVVADRNSALADTTGIFDDELHEAVSA